jgi:cysteinyl-tRNA synthetase
MLKLYNTLTKNIENFVPLNPPKVGLYTCGMTVYDFAHIGHGKKYVGDDLLRRVLIRFGYDVMHVQNVTDVGHLVSDGDDGEDKMEKGAKKAGKTVWEVAEAFTKHFYDSMDRLNILRPTVVCKATEHIKEQIELVQKLLDKGLAYDTPEAVYFDVEKFPEYGKLLGQNIEDKKVAVREEVKTGDYKKNPVDFALWFKRVGRFSDHAMHWDSPWGDGFPGWHIECSAMSMKYLGETFDIHTGGIDHIPVHHPNEIAQSEGATGKQFVRFWIHHAFLMVDGKKMSKSLGNYYTIDDVFQKGIDPMALRYFYFTAHYRKSLNFTWEALAASGHALSDLRSRMPQVTAEKLSNEAKAYQKKFDEALENDLNAPNALAVVWEAAKSDLPDGEKRGLLLDFDSVLGLELEKDTSQEDIIVPEEIKNLLVIREKLRQEKNFKEADVVRMQIEKEGYTIEDSQGGVTVKKGN